MTNNWDSRFEETWRKGEQLMPFLGGIDEEQLSLQLDRLENEG